MSYIFFTLEKLKGFMLENSAVLVKVLGAVWLFFAGIHTYLFCVLFLVIMDVITGVLASKKKGEPFKSRILRKGLLEKTALYLVLILVVFILDLLTQNVFSHTTFYFSFLVTFLVSVYEVSSVMENLNVLKPNLPFLSGLVRIFNKLGQSTLDKMEENVDKISDKISDPTGLFEKKEEEKKEESKEG